MSGNDVSCMSRCFRSRKYTVLFSFFVAGIVFLVFVFRFFDQRFRPVSVNSFDSSCPVSLEEKTVRGSSMAPLFLPGETIHVVRGWYVCHVPEHGDVILARYAGDDAPILKRVRGIPGDTFAVHLLESGEGELWVNRERLANSRGASYHVSSARAALWQSYEKQFHGIIPSDSFLLLGEVETGSLDSSRFGFALRKDILGKVDAS